MPAISSWAIGEADRVDEVGARPEPLAHELRHRAHLGAVVERHHHDAEEQHRRDGADPVVVHRRDAELGTVGRHAHDLDGTEVGRDEGQAGHPGGQRATRQEEVEAARDRAPGHQADADDEDEVDRHQDVVDPVGVEAQPRGRGKYHRASRKLTHRWFAVRDARYYRPEHRMQSEERAHDVVDGDRRRRLHRLARRARPRAGGPRRGRRRRPLERAPRVRAPTTCRSSQGTILDTDLVARTLERARRRPASSTSPGSSTPASRSSARCTRTTQNVTGTVNLLAGDAGRRCRRTSSSRRAPPTTARPDVDLVTEDDPDQPRVAVRREQADRRVAAARPGPRDRACGTRRCATSTSSAPATTTSTTPARTTCSRSSSRRSSTGGRRGSTAPTTRRPTAPACATTSTSADLAARPRRRRAAARRGRRARAGLQPRQRRRASRSPRSWTRSATVTGIDFTPEPAPRRPGDPARIVATGELAARDLDWRMRHSLEEMVRSAWEARSRA